MRLISTSFSPMMIGEGEARVREIDWCDFCRMLQQEFTSVIGHANTAQYLEDRVNEVYGSWNNEPYVEERYITIELPFNRTEVVLNLGDSLLCAIPKFRPGTSREFTSEELSDASWRFFYITVE